MTHSGTANNQQFYTKEFGKINEKLLQNILSEAQENNVMGGKLSNPTN